MPWCCNHKNEILPEQGWSFVRTRMMFCQMARENITSILVLFLVLFYFYFLLNISFQIVTFNVTSSVYRQKVGLNCSMLQLWHIARSKNHHHRRFRVNCECLQNCQKTEWFVSLTYICVRKRERSDLTALVEPKWYSYSLIFYEIFFDITKDLYFINILIISIATVRCFSGWFLSSGFFIAISHQVVCVF